MLKRMQAKVHFTHDILRELSSESLLQLINCRVLRGELIIHDHLWVRNGKIVNAEKVFFDERVRADVQVDCQGLIIAPGFIDIQDINNDGDYEGGYGFDFSTWKGDSKSYQEGVNMLSKRLLQNGVTSYVPTVITSAPETFASVLPLLSPRVGGSGGATILGSHVEGPFICVSKKGAHPEKFIRSTLLPDPSGAILDVYKDTRNIAIVTLAPELPGSVEAVKFLRSRGIVVSLGHSSAALPAGEAAFDAGASCITHLFNAMQSYHHRDPGLIGLLSSTAIAAPAWYGIIADGVHTHDSALRMAYRTCPEGLILVTDAIAAFGMEDGIHVLGVQKICKKGSLATVEGTNITAGSVASMPLCIAHLVKAAKCSLQEAIACATRKPAALMGLTHKKGALEEGADADFVIIAEDVEVKATFINGRLVYSSE